MSVEPEKPVETPVEKKEEIVQKDEALKIPEAVAEQPSELDVLREALVDEMIDKIPEQRRKSVNDALSTLSPDKKLEYLRFLKHIDLSVAPASPTGTIPLNKPAEAFTPSEEWKLKLAKERGYTI